jgi:hypothetical protein
MFFYVSEVTGCVVQIQTELDAARMAAWMNVIVFQADLTVEGVA